MSRSAIQVAKAATYLPDLVEVQRSSFKWFLEKGLIEELDNFSPITDYTVNLSYILLEQNISLSALGMM